MNTFERLLDKLPPVVAIPVKRYIDEDHPSAKLLRLCDAVEMITRFTLLMVVGILNKDYLYVEKVAAKIKPKIERPTFGDLLTMLDMLFSGRKFILNNYSIAKDIKSLYRAIKYLLAGPARGEGLLAVRNLFIHSGGFKSDQCIRLLKRWEPKFGKLACYLEFLSNLSLCLVKNQSLHQFCGMSREPKPINNIFGINKKTLQKHNGQIVLLGYDLLINLWPFLDYGKAKMRWLGIDEIARDHTPLIFARADRSRWTLIYTALGGDLPFSERTKDEHTKYFFELFGLVEADSITSSLPLKWIEKADTFVGRKEEIRRIIECIDAALVDPDPEWGPKVLWLGGRPGVGKSALMAKIASHYVNQDSVLCIPWSFKAQNVQDTHPDRFYALAIRRLSRWKYSGKKRNKPSSDPENYQQLLVEILTYIANQDFSLEKVRVFVLFLLDGMDEAAIIDPKFILRPLNFRYPNVVWLCAGRADGTEQLSKAEGTLSIFEDSDGLLPRMRQRDIRSMLLNRLGPIAPQVACGDEDTVGGVKNRITELIAQRGDGLPLYIQFVVTDLKTGKLNISNLERQLPIGLKEYYRELLLRQGTGKVPILKTRIMVLAAVTHSPVTPEILIKALIQWKTIKEHEAGLVNDVIHGLTGMLKPVNRIYGEIGYEPFHFSLTEHIREDQDQIFLSEIDFARNSLIEIVKNWQNLPKGSTRHYALNFGIRHILEAQDMAALKNLLLNTNYLNVKLSEFGERKLFADLRHLPPCHSLSFSLKPCIEKLMLLLDNRNSDSPRLAAFWLNALGAISYAHGIPFMETCRASAKRYRQAALSPEIVGPKMASRLVRNAAWNLMSAGDLTDSIQAFMESTVVLEEQLGRPVDITAAKDIDLRFILRVTEHRVREINCRVRVLLEKTRNVNQDQQRLILQNLTKEIALHKQNIGQKTSWYLKKLCEELLSIGINKKFTQKVLSNFDPHKFTNDPEVIVVSNEFDIWVADILLDWLHCKSKPHLLLSPEQFADRQKWSSASEIYIFGGPKAPHIGRCVTELFGDQREFEKLFVDVENEDGFGKVFKRGGKPTFWLIAGNDEETLDATIDLMKTKEPHHPVWSRTDE